MGVPTDDRRKPGCSGVEIERVAVVEHIKGVPVEGNYFRSRQVAAGPTHIDVAANGRDWREVAE
jgi:hypothetical protein